MDNLKNYTAEGFFNTVVSKFKSWRKNRAERNSYRNIKVVEKTYGNAHWVQKQVLKTGDIHIKDLNSALIFKANGSLDVKATVRAYEKQLEGTVTFLKHIQPALNEYVLSLYRVIKDISYASDDWEIDRLVEKIKSIPSPLEGKDISIDVPFKPTSGIQELLDRRLPRSFDRHRHPTVGNWTHSSVETVPALSKEEFVFLSNVLLNCQRKWTELTRQLNNLHTPPDESDGMISYLMDSAQTKDEKPSAMEESLNDLVEALTNNHFYRLRDFIENLGSIPVTTLGRLLHRNIAS